MRRLKLQFPLRTLLTLVLAVACFFGGRVSRNEELAEARRELQRSLEAIPLNLAYEPPMLIGCDIPYSDFYDLATSQPMTIPPDLPAVQVTLEDLPLAWPEHCGCKH